MGFVFGGLLVRHDVTRREDPDAVHRAGVLDEHGLHEEVGLAAVVEEARDRARLGGIDAHLGVRLLLRRRRDLGQG